MIRLKIIIPVNTDKFTDQISASVNHFRSGSVEIDLEHITQGTPFIQSRLDLTINAPHVIQIAVQAEHDGYDGIFVSDMDMCGVEAARQAIKIPVVGGFRPSLYTAMLLGQRVAILTVSNVLDLQNEHIRAFGVSDNLATIRPLDLCVSELEATGRETQIKILHELEKLAITAIQTDNASCIMFGCTGFTDYAHTLSRNLSQKFGQNVPVMDPNSCAIGYLLMLVQNQLTQSGLTYPYISSSLHQ